MSLNSRWKKLEIALSISSIIIAFCAIIMTYYESSATRKHNKLSVQPLIQIKGTNNNDNAKIAIANNGLGPAIIDRILINYRGVAYLHATTNWGKILYIPNLECNYTCTPITIVKPGENEDFIVLNYNKDNYRTVKQFCSELRFTVFYKNLYGDTFSVKGGGLI